MSSAQADFRHLQDTSPGLTTGMIMPVIRHIVAVPPIVTIGETLLVLMYRRHTAQIRNGILYHSAKAVTREQDHLMWTRSLFLSQVIFKTSNYE